MPQVRRTGPYIWATWLTRLLTGEASCEWASQFKARHESGSWEKAASDFDQGQWMLRHTALLNDERLVWERGGHVVTTESQNHFTLRGNAAVVAGKPDLIAVRNNVVTIIDVKTGKPSPSHVAQVALYMYAVPKAIEEYRGMDITGRVAYKEHAVDVPAGAVDENFVKTLGELIKRLAAETPARRVPSPQECRWCDITARDCSERMEWEHRVREGATDDF